jgi:hypothetical protein
MGFHTLVLYVHNDVMLAFCTPEKQKAKIIQFKTTIEDQKYI